jgi:opacity protein-like surface antigen
MKKILAGAVLLFNFSIVNAQKIHLTLFGGISNYQGDLQSKRFTFQQANAAFGIGGLYDFTDKLHLLGNVNFGKVAGSDVLSSTYRTRNLSFSSPLTDVHLGLEYDLLDPAENSLTPYVFAGISYFHFNPSTLDSTGKKVFLQPLGTEGQGFLPGREKYNLNSFAIPFGGGVKLALSQNIKVRFEFGLRKTYTDYLDDVSTTYADENELLLNNGAQAVDLAFRGDENKSGITYPAANTIRGNSKSKDWYYFTGLGVSFRLFSGTSGGASSGKTKTGCPVNIY